MDGWMDGWISELGLMDYILPPLFFALAHLLLSLSLSCRYRWIKNGYDFLWQSYDDRISQQPGRGTLVITTPRDEDIGALIGLA